MRTETRYINHEEMCEFLDIPRESVLGFENMHYDPRDKMWVLRMRVGTQEEIEEFVESEL